MLRLLPLLAPAQVISWGTLYYAIAFLAGPIAAETGWGREAIFLAFSAGLLVSGFSAAPVGRLVSRYGGRRLLVAGSALAAVGLSIIGLSQNLAVFTLGWGFAGVAMALTQYEAAFSTLRQLIPEDFRRAAGWITVAGGLASTIFWPLTHSLTEWTGWRSTALIFAGLNFLPCLLYHRYLPEPVAHAPAPGQSRSAPDRTQLGFGIDPVIVLLAAAFSASATVTATVSAHASLIMESSKVTTGAAIGLLAVIGPMQIAGRLLELVFAPSISPSTLGLFALLMLSLSVSVLGYAAGDWWPLAVFAVLYGLANGILTIVRGAIPLELLPHRDYAKCLGDIAAPALIARAIAPGVAVFIVGTFGVQFLPGALAAVAAIGFTAILGAVMLSRSTSLADRPGP